ncbi:MAG: hypothetical protein EHM59_07620 [Betaproteobacteria bacterium]|nr:MAG: hypothetical protein EHM59_07620 [Betaproteobacteria bacterium]
MRFPELHIFVIYASRSTGHPKGVQHDDQNALVETRAYSNATHVTADDEISLCAPLSFAMSVCNLYGALVDGTSIDLQRRSGQLYRAAEGR